MYCLPFAVSFCRANPTGFDRTSGRRRVVRNVPRRGRGVVAGHTRPDWTYPMRVSAGMRDLRSLYVRANTCVACHQNIDNALLKAGHPTMVFELDRQSIDQPRHWREDDPWIGPRAWLTGQAVALREAAWHARVDVDLTTTSASSGGPLPDAREAALALAWLLAKVTATDPALPKILESSSSDLEPLQRQADELAQRAAIWKPNTDSTMSMLRTLAATDVEFTRSGKSCGIALLSRPPARSRARPPQRRDQCKRFCSAQDRQRIEDAARRRALARRFQPDPIRPASPRVAQQIVARIDVPSLCRGVALPAGASYEALYRDRSLRFH